MTLLRVRQGEEVEIVDRESKSRHVKSKFDTFYWKIDCSLKRYCW